MKNDLMIQGRDLRGKWGAAYWVDGRDNAYAFAQKYADNRGVKVRVTEWFFDSEVGKGFKYFEPSGMEIKP